PRDHPVTPREHATASPHAAPAACAIAAVFLHRPVVRQLLAGPDVTQGDEHDLSADAEIRGARMVDEHLVAPHLGGRARAEEDAVGDLDVRVRDAALDLRQRARVVDVPAFDGDDLAPADSPPREEPPTLDRARADVRLG